MVSIRPLMHFMTGCLRLVLRGNALYWTWMLVLLALTIGGGIAYWRQLHEGLATTSMRDQVSWAFYIGNFTFLVGVAAAAVLLVIPAYVYSWGPIKEVVIFGELLAIAAVVMAALFVLVDVGHPERLFHLVPVLGYLNFPSSLLAWDVIVLNGYLVLNVGIVFYVLWSTYKGRHPKKGIFAAVVLFTIPFAISIHTVTAFLYNGLIARPFWNSAILAPRFIASAFCSGPAVLLILMQFLRRFTRFHVQDLAIHKIAELMAYAMAVNLFLLGAEIFTEVYSNTEHVVHLKYMFVGVDGHSTIAPFMWFSVTASIVAMVLFLIPRTRRHPVTLNLGCVLIYFGVYFEKGMGLVIPGFTPDTLGEIYEYFPSMNEIWVAVGIFSIGFLVFTLLVKITTPIMLGEFHETLLPAKKGEVGSERSAPALAH